MGMFDYLRCEIPLPVGNGFLFQTKDLHDEMKEWTLRKDGRLVKHEYDTEATPEAELLPEENLKAPEGSIFKLFGIMRTVKGSERLVEYTGFDGDLVFYPDVSHVEEVEYRATFRKGVLRELAKREESGWEPIELQLSESIVSQNSGAQNG